jgi:antitoxin component YwqK of YwqJK toxin-antitoxin module
MKKLLVFFFSFFIALNTSSEIKKTYYDNGQIMSETDYKGNIKDGEQIWWHENGQMKHKAIFVDDKLNGKWSSWHDSGVNYQEGNYLNNNADGVWTFIGENGNKYKEEIYINGIPNGLWISWNRYMQIALIENYQNSILVNALVIKYYERGKGRIENTSNYKNKLLNGKSTTWYENGQKFIEGHYKNDKADGKWVFWKKSGLKDEERNYKDGDLVDKTIFKYTLFSKRLNSVETYKDNLCISGC